MTNSLWNTGEIINFTYTQLTSELFQHVLKHFHKKSGDRLLFLSKLKWFPWFHSVYWHSVPSCVQLTFQNCSRIYSGSRIYYWQYIFKKNEPITYSKTVYHKVIPVLQHKVSDSIFGYVVHIWIKKMDCNTYTHIKIWFYNNMFILILTTLNYKFRFETKLHSSPLFFSSYPQKRGVVSTFSYEY